MQLDPISPAPSVLGRLRAAACVLLAAGAPAAAHADAATQPYQFEASTLMYAEKDRAKVLEPMARLTRLFSGGTLLGVQFAYDVITGASPTGARPSGGVQTITTPSGGTSTTQAGALPLTSFHDKRWALDLDWTQPAGALFNATTGGHYSHEKDYQSTGVSEKLSLDTNHRMLTWSVGGGYNQDYVFPVGGIPEGLSPGGTLSTETRDSKQVVSVMAGVARVMSRRWLMALDATSADERGYLTEPYKVVSIIDPATQIPSDHLTEKRPEARRRNSVLASSVYHLTQDVMYFSYRYYWDEWSVQSHTLDARYRAEIGNESFLQPHVRFYTQTAAKFFTLGLASGAPLPEFASSDQRLSQFNSMTLGLTYGFKPRGYPGEWTVRAEYIRQFGHLNLGPAGGEGGEEGAPATPDPFPPLDIGTLTAGYTVSF
ncbi:MAG: DUF3570 domain-containing protein [Candidatus Eiseniibacteriota bacterium]